MLKPNSDSYRLMTVRCEGMPTPSYGMRAREKNNEQQRDEIFGQESAEA